MTTLYAGDYNTVAVPLLQDIPYLHQLSGISLMLEAATPLSLSTEQNDKVLSNIPLIIESSPAYSA